jgi:photosystem II stability/assembly factor-like uncharacterized protein
VGASEEDVMRTSLGRAALALVWAFTAMAGMAAEADDPLAGLEYRSIGPAAGGRVSRVTGVPGDPLTYFAATAAGGVWKSDNGGRDWRPVFDEQPISSTGSIAVSPADPNLVWVGSGEANIRGNVAAGNGIYRSTDAGESWQHVWKQEGQIGTMDAHPTDPDVAFAAVLGHAFGPNPERGVYRTRDGGESWQQVLAVDEETGASDVSIDPSNPRVVFAGTWQARRTPWGLTSGGPGGGLWVSRDGGDDWTRLEGEGLPDGPWGKVGVRVAPSRPDRVYALIEAEEGGLFRSDDGGASWELINASRGLRQRAWYYTTLTVDPTDADTVWFHQVTLLETEDGGRTVRSVAGGGWDYHDVWIDPADPKRMVVGSDAGVSVSSDGGTTFHRPPLPIAQLYHVSTDTRTPYRVLATLQDLGTVSGPSNSLHDNGIYVSDWHEVGGGEAGHIVADPVDPDIVWAGEYLGIITRFDERSGQARNVSAYPWNGSGHPAADLGYRFQWTAPIAVSPHDHQVVYHAANVLFRTRDGGQSWEAISPDLTRNDPEKQAWSGGPITGDITGVETYCTIFAVAESPLEAGLIWAGTDDGRLWLTRDGGGEWTELTAGLRGLPEWGTVSAIEPSRWEAGTAYVVVDAHRLDDMRPYLWKTADYGATWTSLAGDLAEDVYLHVVREDTVRRGLLFLGTERGVAYSTDDGASWQPLKLDLPTVAVADLAVHGDDLVVGTTGRSIWILDDLTPVREMSETVRSAVHLFPPRPAIRWRRRDVDGDPAGAGSNPPNGVHATYWLAEAPAEGTVVTLEVLDAEGTVVRTLRSVPEPLPIDAEHPDWRPGTKIEPALTARAGLNRAVWDFAWDGAGFIPDAMIDWGDPMAGPWALPGEYTLRLTVGEETATATARVEPDPRVEVSAAELAGQLAFTLGLRDDIRAVIGTVERLRSVREQVAQRNELLAARDEAADLVAAGEALIAKLDALEARLHNPEAEVSYDILAGRGGGAQLYSQLAPLYSATLEGDGPPTQGMREVAAGYRERLTAYRAELDTLIAEDLARLEEQAAALDLGWVLLPPGR